ncbi:MAG: mannose-1-phosphate guanylyltransferase [Bacteroidales bacterium]|nr:mannose-1-phosphate guanylyltransferase [Bacteroidales bacterium]
MNSHFYCVIMAGGIGSRFWPISRFSKPKQFLSFGGQKTFLRMTYDRFSGIVPPENIIVVSLAQYADLVREQLPELPAENLLLEPYNRNTAPCLAYATYSLLKRDPEAVVVATPADHLIGDLGLFEETISAALAYAAGNDSLITLGIVPDRPDTNFGYIQATGGKESYNQNIPVKVKTFTEKPDQELAEVFLASGEFLWNSGIFVWQASVIRGEMEQYLPEVTELFRGWESRLGTPEEGAFIEKVYMNMERISVDYGVMEKTEKAWLYPAKFGWADIGNWESLYSYLSAKDADGNAVKNGGKTLLQQDRDNVIYSTAKNKLVAVKGLENYIVIDTDDILMICPRDDRKIKEVISQVGMPGFEEYR